MYRIRNWDAIYEKNRTRDVKVLSWIALPIKLDGDGYCTIMEQEDGPAIFGAWIACLEVAARNRGDLVRSDGSDHDAKSLSRITRIDEKCIQRMLDFCTLVTHWFITVDSQGATMSQEGATLPQESATMSQEPAQRPVVYVLSSDVMSSSEEKKENTNKDARVDRSPTAAEVCEAQASGTVKDAFAFLDAGPQSWQSDRNPALILRPFLAALKEGATVDGLIKCAASYRLLCAKTDRKVAGPVNWLSIEHKNWLRDWDKITGASKKGESTCKEIDGDGNAIFESGDGDTKQTIKLKIHSFGKKEVI